MAQDKLFGTHTQSSHFRDAHCGVKTCSTTWAGGSKFEPRSISMFRWGYLAANDRFQALEFCFSLGMVLYGLRKTNRISTCCRLTFFD